MGINSTIIRVSLLPIELEFYIPPIVKVTRTWFIVSFERLKPPGIKLIALGCHVTNIMSDL